MKKRIRNWIKNYFDLYDIEDMITGGHCGCCGNWIANEIYPVSWAVGICSECLARGKNEKE